MEYSVLPIFYNLIIDNVQIAIVFLKPFSGFIEIFINGQRTVIWLYYFVVFFNLKINFLLTLALTAPIFEIVWVDSSPNNEVGVEGRERVCP